MKKQTLHDIDKLEQIREVLVDNHEKFTNMGLLNGLLGVSLYHYYYYLYTEDENYLEGVITYLEKSIEGLSNDYKGTHIVNDIMELGNYVTFLNECGLIDREDVNALLVDSDAIVSTFMENELEKRNLDPILGAIKAGYYFLNRNKFIDKKAELLKLLNAIQAQAIDKVDIIYWESTLKNIEKLKTELGISHGVSGIVNFLLQTIVHKIPYEHTKELILGGLHFINIYIEDAGVNKIRIEADHPSKLKYQDIAYGDIGIGYTYVKAGTILNIKTLTETGIQLINNAATFRDDENVYIKDGSLFYGTAGLSAMFSKINTELHSDALENVANYWGEKTMAMGNSNSKWAGYSSNYNAQHDYTHLSLSEGICGIGIMLMAQQKKLKHDYLQFFNLH
ncbi:MAG: lanthionine synthetase LanC family protein [Bacteroidota bacterium]